MLPIKPANFDSYITAFPEGTQELLEQLRATIKKAAPEAREIISYGMPAFKLTRILVYFAAHKNHIGFYPGASGIEAFQDDIKGYKWAKGTVQFPLDQPLPLDLITRIVKFRVDELSMISKTKKR
jgi:uncharacterized protein YdhG (YjbR/CyaY superfamily)